MNLRRLILLVFVAAQFALADDAPFQRRASAAIQQDQQALQADPKNKEALSDIGDQLDGAGRWKEALPYLATLNEVEPNNAARAHQLGMYYGWTDGGSTKALPLLQHAAELEPQNSQYAYDHADLLARSADHRAQGVTELRSIVDRDPKFMS